MRLGLACKAWPRRICENNDGVIRSNASVVCTHETASHVQEASSSSCEPSFDRAKAVTVVTSYSTFVQCGMLQV